MARIYGKNVTEENMPTNQGTEPEQEEREREEDQIDPQRSKRKLIRCLSSTDDLSADNVFDKEPHRRITKLMAKYPRPSLPAGSLLEESIKLMMKSRSRTSSSTVVSCSRSNNGELHISRVSHAASQGNNVEQEVPGLPETGDFLSSWGKNDESEVPALLETGYFQGNNEEVPGLLEAIQSLVTLKTGKEMDLNVPGTSKRNNKSRTGKKEFDLMGMSRENMLSFLKDIPQLQLEAICALYRHDRKTHGQITIRLSDSLHAKVQFVAEFVTCGNVHGPCIKTPEELEETYKGSMTFCWCLISCYSSELYHICCGGLDQYFC